MKLSGKPLSYWKARSVQLRNAIAEWQKLKRFADHKVEQLEREKLSVKQWVILIAAATICLL